LMVSVSYRISLEYMGGEALGFEMLRSHHEV